MWRCSAAARSAGSSAAALVRREALHHAARSSSSSLSLEEPRPAPGSSQSRHRSASKPWENQRRQDRNHGTKPANHRWREGPQESGKAETMNRELYLGSPRLAHGRMRLRNGPVCQFKITPIASLRRGATHSLESRLREIRQSGSEVGSGANPCPVPTSILALARKRGRESRTCR